MPTFFVFGLKNISSFSRYVPRVLCNLLAHCQAAFRNALRHQGNSVATYFAAQRNSVATYFAASCQFVARCHADDASSMRTSAYPLRTHLRTWPLASDIQLLHHAILQKRRRVRSQDGPQVLGVVFRSAHAHQGAVFMFPLDVWSQQVEDAPTQPLHTNQKSLAHLHERSSSTPCTPTASEQ